MLLRRSRRSAQDRLDVTGLRGRLRRQVTTFQLFGLTTPQNTTAFGMSTPKLVEQSGDHAHGLSPTRDPHPGRLQRNSAMANFVDAPGVLARIAMVVVCSVV